MLAIPSAAVEIVGVTAGFAAGITVGMSVHRLIRDPQRRGPWRSRAAFWLAWFSGALVGQSVALFVAGRPLTAGSSAPATGASSVPPTPWMDALGGAAMLATLFTVVYMWKFASGMRAAREAPPPAEQ